MAGRCDTHRRGQHCRLAPRTTGASLRLTLFCLLVFVSCFVCSLYSCAAQVVSFSLHVVYILGQVLKLASRVFISPRSLPPWINSQTCSPASHSGGHWIQRCLQKLRLTPSPCHGRQTTSWHEWEKHPSIQRLGCSHWTQPRLRLKLSSKNSDDPIASSRV